MKKTNFIVMAMLLMGLAFFVNMDTASAASSIYVNVTSGNDAWDGSSQFYINGTTGPKRTINGGVNVVDANGTVNIANGIYTGNGNNGITIGKNMTIKGQSKDGTIINGSNNAKIFTISNGFDVKLLNLTITNGRSNDGGAITNNGKLTINNCVIKNSRSTGTGANYGGAIYSTNTGTLTIINSNFTSNIADTNGGAIYADGNVTIIGSTFSSNTATQDGGVIYTNSNLYITDSSFTSNTANMANNGAGGAICQGDSSTLGLDLIISNSIFTSNRGQHGGALWTIAGTSTKPANITNTTFTSNVGTYGGAIRNWGYLNVAKSSFVSNSATEGGAINNYQNILTVTESNFINNAATTGGALYNAGGTSEIHFNRIIGNTGTDLYFAAGTLNAQNNWWGNNLQGSNPLTAGRVNANVNTANWLVLNTIPSPSLIKVGGVSTITADLTHDNTGSDTSSQGHIPDGIPINFVGILGSIGPSTTINGRATATFTAGSKPGVAVVNATVDAQTVNTTVTIGRDDVYVSPTGNDVTGDGSASNPYKTIATGISGLYPGGTIHIANGTYNEHDLTINKNMTIVGDSANSTIINGQQLGRLFNITSGSTVSISGLTLANGNATGNGGAISNAGNLTITGTNLLNNAATGTGGTIYNTGIIEMHFNKILGNGTVIASPSGSVDATLNWWDSNTSPSSKVSGNVDVSTWLVLRVTTSQTTIPVGGNSTVTADLTYDNTGVYHDPVLGNVPDGIIITFNVVDPVLGVVSSVSVPTVNGVANTTFIGVNSGLANIRVSQEDLIIITGVNIGTVTIGMRNYNVMGLYNNRRVGHTFPWVIDVYNNGPNAATGVVVEYVISEGYEFLTCSPRGVGIANYNATTRTITWNIGYMPSGGIVYLDVALRITDSGTLNTTARLIHVDQVNLNTTTEILRNMTVTVAADIQVDQNVSNSHPNVGENLQLDLAVWNNGPDNATGIKIRYDLPVQLTFNNYTASKGTFYNTGLGYWIWDIGSLTDGEIVTLNINTTVSQAGTFNSTARRNGTAQQFDWIVNNNAKSVIIETSGQPVHTPTYTIQLRNYNVLGLYTNRSVKHAYPWLVDVTNSGPDAASNVIIEYILGDGYELLTYSPRGVGTATYNATTRTITWNIGYMPSGGITYMDVVLRVLESGSLISTAQVQNTSKTNTTSMGVVPNADIQVNQNASNVNPNVGENVQINLTTQNNGPDAATAVKIRYYLPTGLTYNNYVASKGTFYNTGLGYWIWDIGNLTNGELVTLNINTTVNQAGIINSTVQRNGTRTSWDQADWNVNNNIQTIFLVVPTADIQVNQTVDIQAPQVDSIVTFSITVINNGPNTANNVEITDQLPSRLSFISANGSYDSIIGIWSLGALGSGESKTLTLMARVINSGVIVNTASKTKESEYDPNNTNNMANVTLNVN